ncbi:hypothetical protein AVEN_166681-1 [Araneus ventricosus]|uniref:Uncharacterized protein n=1 Tax=Araneus ventricosus TaxID=182803 RepID=A0A4Y2HGH4_ARAVE|nr:hypothetical protein AVEN_166681-1 [Araneus ventricosus]
MYYSYNRQLKYLPKSTVAKTRRKKSTLKRRRLQLISHKMDDVIKSSVLTGEGHSQADDENNHLCDWLKVERHSRGKPAHNPAFLLAECHVG